MDLIAMEPDIYIPDEGGSVEIWSTYTNLFPWVVVRYTIYPNGLVLPLYTKSDNFGYTLQGKGLFGLMSPECSQESDSKKNECQKVNRLQSGDMLVYRAGEIYWLYNDGNDSIIIINVNRVSDAGSIQYFYLAGRQNILRGFSLKFLSEAFNINIELAMKLQSKNTRGNFIYVTSGGLHLSCQRQNQLEPNGNYSNIMKESFCNINMRLMKITDPLNADLFILKVGYIKTIDARQLPILKTIQLSATYHFLLKDVMRLPHWENSDSIMYVVEGEGRIQVVNENGMNVFDDVIKGGQLLIVPKNFVMAELAKSEKLKYITFKTNANSITSDLTGRNSVMYGLPLDVVTNAYNITKGEAKRVKFGRKEISLVKIMSKYI